MSSNQTSNVKERPVIFSVEMIRALLAGKKTQTRRVLKLQPPSGFRLANVARGRKSASAWFTSLTVEQSVKRCAGEHLQFNCPYGRVGDSLWVKEAWQAWVELNRLAPSEMAGLAATGVYANDQRSRINYLADGNEWKSHRRNPLFMPRWASRLTLELTDVRVERVRDISREDVLAEGFEPTFVATDRMSHADERDRLREQFAVRWNALNAARGFPWESNPWVWALTFRVLPAPA